MRAWRGWLGSRRWWTGLVVVLGVTGWTLVFARHVCPPGTGTVDCIIGALGSLSVVWAVAFLIVSAPRERKAMAGAYDAAWRGVCPVLGADHHHEGTLLHGTWGGRRFRASARQVYLGPYGGTSRSYSVRMPAGKGRAAWRCEPAPGCSARSDWFVRTDHLDTEQRLAAGLRPVIGEAQTDALHFRDGARLSYDPSHAVVRYEDASGAPPCGHDFLVHLELVRRAVDISDALAVDDRTATGGRRRFRPRMSVTGAPAWVLGLCIPAAIVDVVGVDTSLWYALPLPLALLAPLAWRVRLGR